MALIANLSAPRLRTIVWAGALSWVGVLVGLLFLFSRFGETAWPVVLLLYLPRHLWLLPGLMLLWPACRSGPRAVFFPLAAGFVLWLFPIMGFVLPFPKAQATGPAVRVLSFNTSHAVDGADALRELVLETRTDIALFQWTSHVLQDALSGPGFEAWTVRREGQFTIATRFSLRSMESVGLPAASIAPCAHAVIDTPLGTLDVFDIRPQSAREEIGAQRNLGVGQRLRSFIADARAGRFAAHARFREQQVRSISEAIHGARHPVLVAGDTNLPTGSILLQRYFGGLGDAFADAGWGLGYTHPAKLPWMRLDRVLLGPELRALSFEVLPRHVAGHRPVLAEIARSSR